MSDKYIMYDPAEFDKIEIKPAENSDEITRLRAENSKSKSLISELLDYAESLEGRLDSHDLGMLEDTDLKSRARAALEGVMKPPR